MVSTEKGRGLKITLAIWHKCDILQWRSPASNDTGSGRHLWKYPEIMCYWSDANL